MSHLFFNPSLQLDFTISMVTLFLFKGLERDGGGDGMARNSVIRVSDSVSS